MHIDIELDCQAVILTKGSDPNIMAPDSIKSVMLEILRNSANRDLTTDEEDKLNDHLDIIDRTFKMDETITYQELDSIDTPGLYTEDDVVEVFIRANSGGTKLGKSDLLFLVVAI